VRRVVVVGRGEEAEGGRGERKEEEGVFFHFVLSLQKTNAIFRKDKRLTQDCKNINQKEKRKSCFRKSERERRRGRERRSGSKKKKKKKSRAKKKKKNSEAPLLRPTFSSLRITVPLFPSFFFLLKNSLRDRSYVAPLQRPLQGGRPLRPPPRPGRHGFVQVSSWFWRLVVLIFRLIDGVSIVAPFFLRSTREEEQQKSLAAAIASRALFLALSPRSLPLLPPLPRWDGLLEPLGDLEANKREGRG